MGKTIDLPVRVCKGTDCVQIPHHIFGRRVTIQAHEIKDPKRGRDPCDGHECAQTDAKGDIQFFSRTIEITNIK